MAKANFDGRNKNLPPFRIEQKDVLKNERTK